MGRDCGGNLTGVFSLINCHPGCRVAEIELRVRGVLGVESKGFTLSIEELSVTIPRAVPQPPP
jgi:hypothetical protein